MTEIADTGAAKTESAAQTLPPAVTSFILHWGDLGSQWGVNRSVAQIHALLYLSETPMTAERIAELLGLARSNVSNSLKELLAWQLIQRVPQFGDRRDHYVAQADIWEMVLCIARGRKAREIDPAEAALIACTAEADADPAIPLLARERLHTMLDFVTTMSRWHDEMLRVPRPALMRLVKMGARVTHFLGRGRG